MINKITDSFKKVWKGKQDLRIVFWHWLVLGNIIAFLLPALMHLLLPFNASYYDSWTGWLPLIVYGFFSIKLSYRNIDNTENKKFRSFVIVLSNLAILALIGLILLLISLSTFLNMGFLPR